jgi:hypothetical protein
LTTELLEGASINGNVIIASASKIVYFPIKKGRTYKVSATPLSGSPIYKWGNTTETPVVGTSIIGYDSGGGISSTLTRQIIAENNGYHIIEVMDADATIKVEIVE